MQLFSIFVRRQILHFIQHLLLFQIQLLGIYTAAVILIGAKILVLTN